MKKFLLGYEKVEPIKLKNIASSLMYEKSVFKYMKDGKYGLIDFNAKEVTKPIYDEIEGLPYKEGELLVKQNDKYGVINIKGNKLIEIEYDEISVDGYYTDDNKYDYAGYIVSNKTEQGFRYGYIDIEGKKIVETEYNELSRIIDIVDNNNVYLICAKNGQYGVNKNSEEIIKNEYQSIRYDKENNILVVEKSKKFGIQTLEGKIIIPIEYEQIDIVGMYIYAEKEGETVVYNNDGTKSDIDTNTQILKTNNENYKIKIDNENGSKYGLINKDSQELIGNKYNYMEYLFDNYFIVSNEKSKLGVIDDKENVKIEIQNDSVQKLKNSNIIEVTDSDTNITTLYSQNIEKICEMKNAIVEEQDEYIKIYNETETKYFNKDGKELTNKEIYPSNKLFANKENEKWGFVDANGNKVVECIYDKVTELNEYGYAGIKKDDKWGVINSDGKVFLNPTYNMKNQIEPSFIGEYYKVTYGFGEFYYTDTK